MTRARELAKLANSSIFSVDSSNNVGINSLTPDAKLDVVGVVSATQYFGDGSNLTGIVAGATLNASSGTQRLVVTSQTSGSMTQAATNADITYDTSTNILSATKFSGTLLGNSTGLQGTPSITVQDITAEQISVGGTLTYEDVTNVDSVGLITARTGLIIQGTGIGLSVTGGGARVTGIVTATSFSGDGSALTGISAGITTDAQTPSNTVVTLNLTNQDHKLTVTGITTITVSGGTEGDSHTIRLINSGIATVGFSTYFLFPSGSTPSIPTTDGAISLLSFTVNRVGAAGTQLLAGAALNFS